MKRILLALCAFVLTSSLMAQTQVNQVAKSKKADELVKFSENKFDFGKIKQGVPVTHDFAFQNVGSQPVVIESASASCGCTTPSWPKTPVTKSKNDKISAGFNAASPGPFDKTITVKVAGFDLPLELRITGEVLSVADYAKYEATKGKKNG
ncbi:MAG: DUF1573 domain-containing protein [Chitinophagaceae bacterium]